MAQSDTKIHDFTASAPAFSITVEARPVYEALTHLFVWSHGSRADYADTVTFDLMEHAGAEILGMLQALGDNEQVWPSLIGIATEPGVKTVSDLIRRLDEKALEHILECRTNSEHTAKNATALPSTSPAEFGDKLISILTKFETENEPELADRMAILERSAEEKRAMARRMSPADLVEEATGGVALEIGPQVAGILLIPSIAIRPWALLCEHEGTRIVCYSVTDEVLNADPEAPPAYLVDLFKALGDERRLSMLKLISQGNTTLRELTDHTGLAKSTAHHHIGALRRAGLIRVVVTDDDNYYQLRSTNVGDAGSLLRRFLGQDN